MLSLRRIRLGFAFAALLLNCAIAQSQQRATPPAQVPPAAMPQDIPVSFPLGSDEEFDNERRIHEALAKRISLEVKDVSLREVVSLLSDQLNIAIVLTKKIEDAGVTPDQPITVKLPQVTLRSGLRLILGDLSLTNFIKDDVIKITTIEDAQQPHNMTIRLYPVKDLLDLKRESNEDRQVWDFDPLIRLIQEVEPDSWRDVGGPGTVIGFDNGACLFIHQRADLHEAIGKLLTTLRKVKAVQGLKDPPRPFVPNRYVTPGK